MATLPIAPKYFVRRFKVLFMKSKIPLSSLALMSLITAPILKKTAIGATVAKPMGVQNSPHSSAPISQNSTLFLEFARAAEAIGATPKRLEKAVIIAKYFEGLPDDDLVLAARFFGGRLFDARDGRVVNVGGAALMSAIISATGGDENALRGRLVALGDAGDVAFEAFSHSPNALREAHYSLRQMPEFFAILAATSGTLARKKLLTQWLQNASPLEAKYAVKLLSGDLRIGLKESAVEDAVARAAGVKTAQVQWTNMLTGDIGQTALLARRHQLESAQMQLGHPLKFMLASPVGELETLPAQMPTGFVVEDKYDGIRAQAHAQRGADGQMRVALFSRTLDDITRSFPDLVEPLKRMAEKAGHGFILDGEILPVAGQKILPFQELQKRLGRKVVSAETQQQIPVAFMAYDVLFARDRVLIEEAFSARRQLLETLPFDGAHTRLTASKVLSEAAALDDEFVAARERGNEGLMLKDPRSTYKPGRRGKEWLKVKRALATLDVVVTSVEVGSGRRSKVLSDYTFAVRASETDATLLNVGKAYSGLTDVEIATLSEWFRAHTIQEFAHGKVRVVEPKIVLEITFDRVQPSPRHKSGFALRFPRILRIRDDKPAAEIDTLEAVKKLAE